MTVEFNIEQSWRRSFYGGNIQVDSVVQTASFAFGDGTFGTINLTVSSVNLAEDYFVGSAVLSHTYSGAARTITASMDSNARISTLRNNRDQSFRTATTFTVGNANDSPVAAISPVVQVGDNAVRTFQVPAFDPNGDAITYRLATAAEMISPGSGSSNLNPTGLTVSSSGLVTWDIRDVGGAVATVPNDLWCAQVIATDANGASTPIDFIIKVVTATNVPPEFDRIPGAALSVPPGGTLTFDVQASDPDTATPVGLIALNAPAGMTLTPITPTAPYAGTPASATARRVTWTPTPAQAGQTYVINFQATDGQGATTTRSVTISPIANQLPTADAGPDRNVDEGSSITLTGGGSDTDGSIVSYEWDLNYDGTFNTGATGASTTFSAATLDGPTTRTVALRVTDDRGATQIDTAVVTVDNVAPTTTLPADFSVLNHTPVTITGSFTDPGVADTHTFHWHVSLNGVIIIHDHGPSLTFTPTEVGTYTVTYDAVDDDMGEGSDQLILTVLNNPPTATNGSATTNEDNAVSGNLSASDIDSDPLTYSIVTGPTNGTITAFNATTGAFTYTPNANYYGGDSFTFKVSDGTADSNVATVSISVIPVNDDPVANDGNLTTPEDALYAGSLSASDVDGDALTYALGTGASNGSVVVNGDGTYTYTPNANFHGTDSFTFTVSDGNGGFDTATVNVTVTPVNDAPTVTAGSFTINEGESVTLSASGSDIDGDPLTYAWDLDNDGEYDDATTSNPTLTWAQLTALGLGDGTSTYPVKVQVSDGSVTGSGSGTLTVSNVAPTVTLSGPATASEGQTLHYTFTAADPGADAFAVVATSGGAVGVVSNVVFDAATGAGSFDVTFTDGGSTPTASVVSVRLRDSDGAAGNVSEVAVAVSNVAPTPSIDTVGGVRVEGTVIAVVASATDPAAANDTLTYAWAVYKDGSTTAFAGATGVGQTGFGFTPDDNGSYEIVLTVADEDGGSTTVRQTISVANVAPTAAITGAPASSPEGTAIALGSTSSDPAQGNDTLSFAWSVTKNGVAFGPTGTASGFSFAPDDNGTYVVTLTVTDEDGGSTTDSCTITVTNVNPVAAITGAPTSSSEGTAITLGSTATDAGTADTFGYAWSVTKNGAAYASNTAAGFTFTPDDNGVYVVTLTVTDDDGGSATDTRTIAVGNVAPHQVAIGGPTSGVQGFALSFTSTASDVSPVDVAAGFTYAWSVHKGGQSVDLTGVTTNAAGLSFVPTQAGAYTLTLVITDKDGDSTTVTRSVTVSAAAGVTRLPDGRVIIIGTEGDDDIRVNPGSGAAPIKVSLNKADYSFTGVTGVVVYANGGNDWVQIAGGVTVPTTLFGGNGNDRLKAGGGPGILVGGDGDDVLLGGSGRDILIGGKGADMIGGNGADDLLIAGWSQFDANLTALGLLQAEWVSDRSFADRVANLSGTGTGGVNGGVFVTAGSGGTVHDDESVDRLTGDAGNDWFLFNTLGGSATDIATDMTGFEGLFDIDLNYP